MDDPVQDIHGVVRDLCQSDPNTQAQTIDKYFTKYASFTHPFCRTGAFEGSRNLIHLIFRWYKIMSPKIELKIESVAYDSDKMILYVTIHQLFSIWALPFHHSNVTLTTVLQLTHRNPNTLENEPQKYYISSQNDLYQVDQFVRFVLPWFNIGFFLVLAWHFIATAFCALGCVALWPVTWWEQRTADHEGEVVRTAARRLSELVGINGSRDYEVEAKRRKDGQYGNMEVVTPGPIAGRVSSSRK